MTDLDTAATDILEALRKARAHGRQSKQDRETWGEKDRREFHAYAEGRVAGAMHRMKSNMGAFIMEGGSVHEFCKALDDLAYYGGYLWPDDLEDPE